MKSVTTLLLFLYLSTSLCFAQNTKNEVEKSIGMQDMPSKALTLIEQFWGNQSDIEYYLETDSYETSFEAKLNWEGYRYSIEFDSSGALQDIEQLIEFDELTPSLQNKINNTIQEQFSKSRYVRVQRQFTTSDEDDDDAEFVEELMEGDLDEIEVRYEIEIDAQNRTQMGSFELLFDSKGNFLQKRRIVRRSLDNIW